MKKVLIDTNIYSLAMKGDVNVVDVLRKIDRIGFSAISIGELFSGFKGGSRETENREELFRLQRYANFKFYINPRRILRIFRSYPDKGQLVRRFVTMAKVKILSGRRGSFVE